MLAAIQQGDTRAADQLLPVVYEELRKLAAAKMAKETPGHTLQPTALVHEAWLRLAGNANPGFNSRAHFFGAAAEAMRRILIERARRKHAQKHGGGLQRVDLEDADVAERAIEDELLAVNEALDQLAAKHPVPAQLVKLRYYAGMTVLEAAQVLGISVDTAKDYSAFARAWLYREMTKA